MFRTKTRKPKPQSAVPTETHPAEQAVESAVKQAEKVARELGPAPVTKPIPAALAAPAPVRQPPPDPTPAPPPEDRLTCERRTHLRQAHLGDGTLCENAEGEATARVENLVLHGVSFRTDKPFGPGSVWHLKTGSGGVAKLSSAIRVMTCRLRSDGRFDIGAEFF